jgi:hypothetical protein
MILVWQIPRQDDFFDNWDSQARQSGQSEHSAIQIAYKQMGLSENLGYIYTGIPSNSHFNGTYGYIW